MFVTCGSGVNVFKQDGDGFAWCSFPPEDVSLSYSFSSSQWSRDAKWLSCTGTNGIVRVLKYDGKQILPGKKVDLKDVTTSAFLNATNRILVIGTASGENYFWDIKDSKVTNKLNMKHSGSVMLMSVSADDSYISTATKDSAEVNLYGVKTNSHITSFDVKNSTEITGLAFSSIKKGILGASSIESTLCVWDIMKSVNIYNREKCHAGSCSGLAFSPVSEICLATCSYDASFGLFDYRIRKEVAHLKTRRPLKCIDYLADGVHLVLGSTNGYVSIFDLRNLNSVKCEMHVSKDAINWVKSLPNKTPKDFQDADISFPEANEFTVNMTQTDDVSLIDMISPVVCRENSRGSFLDFSDPGSNSPKSVQGDGSDKSTPKAYSEKYDCTMDSFLQQILSPETTQNKTVDSVINASVANLELPALSVKGLSDRISGSSLHRSVVETQAQKRLSEKIQEVGTPDTGTKLYVSNPVTSTPLDGIVKETNPSIYSPFGCGDGLQVRPGQIPEVISAINKCVSDLKKQAETLNKSSESSLNNCISQLRKDLYEQFEKISDVLYLEIKREISNNDFRNRVQHVLLKQQLENLQQDLDNKFAALTLQNTDILEELRRIRQEL